MGARLSLQGRLRLRGPGTVIIEDDVIIGDGADLYTHHPDAVIRIGRGSFLNGTRISAAIEVTIGPENIVGDARILDTDFHWAHRERHQDRSPLPALPIRTGRNVWIGAATVLLKGTEVGEDSVIAMGAVVSGKVPSGEIWGTDRAHFLTKLPEPPNGGKS
jgi:acetyltransferase-like isoleucine patch superfamily enzyme